MTPEELLEMLMPSYHNDQLTPEQFDSLPHDRFRIKDYKGINLNNYHVFKIMDKESPTGYYGMCINKEYAKKMKDTLEKYKSSK